MTDLVVAGQHVAFLCGNTSFPPNVAIANSITERVGNGSVVIGTQTDYANALRGNQSLDTVISYAPSTKEHKLDLFFEVFRVLRGDGLFACLEPLNNRTFEESDALKRNLTLAGFLNPTISPKGEWIQVLAKKPGWEIGTKQTIQIKKKAPVQKQEPVQWKMEVDDNLLDQDALVTDVDLQKPDLDKIRADCGSGKTAGRACKNCSCGRAQEETTGVKKKALTLEMLENPGIDSSCGNCALGDAFRCAGCPYAGLPVFKPGERIVLPEDFFVDDAMIS